ncbi:hypothetical protein Ciccas_009908 [Cichlidogyrus casuarinus]|uniref:G-protein coupled receptors family 1 profile domain-containing protein n=1 Tax=Cichlidogyrus casuarinus TaxID=1844966 RepID=A0ABD2Q074_9PLAT
MDDNRGNSISENWAKIVLIMYLGTPIQVVGIFTSLLTFVMFCYDRITPKTTRHMLQFISVIDAALLIVGLLYLNTKACYLTVQLTNPAYLPDVLWMYKWRNDNKKVLLYMINWCEMTRNWTVVLVGIERYMVTCKPLQASRIWTVRRTHLALILICLCCTLLRIPEIVDIIIFLQETESHEKTKQIQLSRSYIEFLFMGVLPMALLGFCSISIIRVLSSMRVLGAHPQSDRSNDVPICSYSENQDSCRMTNAVRNKRFIKMGVASMSYGEIGNGYSIYTGPSLSIQLPQKNINSAREEIRRRRLKVTRMIMIVLLMFVISAMPSIIYWGLNIVTVNCTGTEGTKWLDSWSDVMVSVHWFVSLSYSTSNFFVYILYMPKYREIIRYLLCVKPCKSSANSRLECVRLQSRKNSPHLENYYLSTIDKRYEEHNCCSFECSCWLMRSLRQAINTLCSVVCCYARKTRYESAPVRMYRGDILRHIPREPRNLYQYNSTLLMKPEKIKSNSAANQSQLQMATLNGALR